MDEEPTDATTLQLLWTSITVPSSYRYLGLLILGQGLHGVGGSILYSLGTVFIDDNVPQTSSPFYISKIRSMELSYSYVLLARYFLFICRRGTRNRLHCGWRIFKILRRFSYC